VCADYVTESLHTHIEDAQASETKSTLDAWRKDIGGYFRRFHPQILDEFLENRNAEAMTLEQRLTLGFLQADLAFLKQHPDDESGACVSVAMIVSNDSLPFWDSRNAEIHIAHVGDTTILLCHVETGHAFTMTPEHHPSSTIESDRLRKFARALATDSFGQERFGLLANTRAFGDARMKKMGVSAEPDVTTVKLGSGAEEYAFLVLCTDGITSVMSDQEIVDIVKGVKEPSDASKAIISYAESLGTDDNSSCLVVRLSGWGSEMPDLTKETREWKLKNEGIDSKTSRSR
jgi:protein phosphatase PTC6